MSGRWHRFVAHIRRADVKIGDQPAIWSHKEGKVLADPGDTKWWRSQPNLGPQEIQPGPSHNTAQQYSYDGPPAGTVWGGVPQDQEPVPWRQAHDRHVIEYQDWPGQGGRGGPPPNDPWPYQPPPGGGPGPDPIGGGPFTPWPDDDRWR